MTMPIPRTYRLVTDYRELGAQAPNAPAGCSTNSGLNSFPLQRGQSTQQLVVQGQAFHHPRLWHVRRGRQRRFERSRKQYQCRCSNLDGSQYMSLRSRQVCRLPRYNSGRSASSPNVCCLLPLFVIHFAYYHFSPEVHSNARRQVRITPIPTFLQIAR